MGGLLGGGGGGTNTVTSSGPPAYLQPYLQALDSAGLGALHVGNPSAASGTAPTGLATPYAGQSVPGQTNPTGTLVAPFTPSTIAAQGAATATAGNVAQNIQPQTQGALNNISSMMQPGANGQNSFQTAADSWSPLTSSGINQAIQADIVPTTQQYEEQIVPQITDQAVQQGAYGGTRAQTVQNEAARDYSQSINNIGAQMTYANQEQQSTNELANVGNLISGNNQTLSAASMIPTLGSAAEQQGLDVSNILGNVGNQQQTQEQSEITAAENEYAQQQQAPFYGLQELGNIFGTGASGGTSTSNVSAPGSTWTNLLSGALGINALANSSLVSSAGNGMSSILAAIMSSGSASSISDAADASALAAEAA